MINGAIDQSLPWGLIFIGVGLAIVAALLSLPTLAFAVGVYLPLSTMAPVFLGGLLRYFVTRWQTEPQAAQRRKQGVLFGSGLVGGEGLMGVGIALYVLFQGKKITGLQLWDGPAWIEGTISLAAIAVILICILVVACTKASDGSE